jgi:cation:H+ antiporter
MIPAIPFLIVGLVLLVYSADFLVKGASSLAAAVGISPLVVGIVLSALLLVYVAFLLRLSRKEKDAGVLSEYEQEYGKHSVDPK